MPTPIVHAARAGRALWHLGALLQFKALMSETDERFWALEGLSDRHMAVPPPAAPPDEAAIAAIVASLQAYGTETLGPPQVR